MKADEAHQWALHQLNLPRPQAEVRAGLLTTWDLTEHQADATMERALLAQARSDRFAGFGGAIFGAILAVGGFAVSAGLSDFSSGAGLGTTGLGGDFFSVGAAAFAVGVFGVVACGRSLWVMLGPGRKDGD